MAVQAKEGVEEEISKIIFVLGNIQFSVPSYQKHQNSIWIKVNWVMFVGEGDHKRGFEKCL